MNDLKLCHKQSILVWLKINLTSTPALVYRSLRSQLAMFIIFLKFSSYGLFLENITKICHFFTKIDITTLSYIALVIVHIQIQYLFSQIHTSKQDSSDEICPILYLLWALAYWLLAIVLFVDLQVLQLLNF